MPYYFDSSGHLKLKNIREVVTITVPLNSNFTLIMHASMYSMGEAKKNLKCSSINTGDRSVMSR